MAAEIVFLPTRAGRAARDLFGDVVRWDGWIYDATTVVEFTPGSLTTEALGSKPRSAQEWWDVLAARWPGAALDILGRLRAGGHGSQDIQVDHSLAVYGGSLKGRCSNVSAAVAAIHDQPGPAASSRALMALAAQLDPEVLADFMDQLAGFLGAHHDIVHP